MDIRRKCYLSALVALQLISAVRQDGNSLNMDCENFTGGRVMGIALLQGQY